MRRSVALPHMVDAAGISCSYKDGLLRIQVPIMPPILSHDDDHTIRVDKLQQELKDSEELVSEFESKLAEHKTTAAVLHLHVCNLKPTGAQYLTRGGGVMGCEVWGYVAGAAICVHGDTESGCIRGDEAHSALPSGFSGLACRAAPSLLVGGH